jgi:hypothetical protein
MMNQVINTPLLSWTTIDKSSWGNGPWQTEPDKAQWQDEETGLPCLAVRNAAYPTIAIHGFSRKLETPNGDPVTMRYLGSLPPNDVRIFVERVSGLDLNYTDTLLLEQARRYLAGFFEEYREGQSRGFIDTVEGPRPFQPFDTYTVSNCVGINQALNMAMMQEVGPGLYTGPTKNPVADLDRCEPKSPAPKNF